MGEITGTDESIESYPVNVVALPIGWLMYKDPKNRSLEFLKCLIDQDDVTVFNIKTVEMIVELLFTNFRGYIYG
jgi:hypothetical protein